MARSTHEDRFQKAVKAWAKADQECSRSFAVWNDACERRKRLAVEKNAAWVELEKSRASTQGGQK